MGEEVVGTCASRPFATRLVRLLKYPLEALHEIIVFHEIAVDLKWARMGLPRPRDGDLPSPVRKAKQILLESGFIDES